MRHSKIPAPYRGTKVPGQEVYDGWREGRHEFATAEGGSELDNIVVCGSCCWVRWR
jgi:hypothetical protein